MQKALIFQSSACQNSCPFVSFCIKNKNYFSFFQKKFNFMRQYSVGTTFVKFRKKNLKLTD